jgi:hypothetical protein
MLLLGISDTASNIILVKYICNQDYYNMVAQRLKPSFPLVSTPRLRVLVARGAGKMGKEVLS